MYWGSVPMFRDVASASSHCTEHTYSFDLREVVAACRSSDAEPDSSVRSIEPVGFVFHESRSGSTAISNALAAAHPDRTRVISEHSAVGEVLNLCDKIQALYGVTDCDEVKRGQLFDDLMYMLGRTTDAAEDLLYVKVQSSATVNMRVVTERFPNAKWAFTYRDANSVIEKDTNKKRNPCVKNRRTPTKALGAYVAGLGLELKDLTDAEVCSAYQATVVSAALDEYESPGGGLESGTGLLIDYDTEINKSDALMDILAHFFGVEGMESETDGPRSRVKKQIEGYASPRRGSRHKSWDGIDPDLIDGVRDEVKEANGKFLKDVMERVTKVKKRNDSSSSNK